MEQPGASSAVAAVVEAARGLTAEDITGIHPHDLLDDLLELRRAVEIAEGEWLRRLSEADAQGAMAVTGAASTQAWVRGAAGLSPRKAHQAVLTARALRRDCRAAAAALADGGIGVEHAHVITRTVTDLPAALPAAARGQAEGTLVDHARRLYPAQLATVARHLRHVVDPDGLARSEEEQHRARFLSVAATLDGTVDVRGTLDAEAGATLLAALQPLTTPVRGPAGERDSRTPGQRRADALVELARRTLDRGDCRNREVNARTCRASSTWRHCAEKPLHRPPSSSGVLHSPERPPGRPPATR